MSLYVVFHINFWTTVSIGYVKLPPEKFAQKKAGEGGKDLPTEPKKLQLNSAEELYAEIRDKNFNAVGAALSKKAKIISAAFEVGGYPGKLLWVDVCVCSPSQARRSSTAVKLDVFPKHDSNPYSLPLTAIQKLPNLVLFKDNKRDGKDGKEFAPILGSDWNDLHVFIQQIRLFVGGKKMKARVWWLFTTVLIDLFVFLSFYRSVTTQRLLERLNSLYPSCPTCRLLAPHWPITPPSLSSSRISPVCSNSCTFLCTCFSY